MKIANVLELLLLAAALGPGWVWINVAERRVARPDRTGPLEAAELVVIGALCTTLAALAVLPGAEAIDALDADAIRRGGAAYLLEHPARAMPVITAVLALSYALAWTAARLSYGRHQPTQQPGTVWREVLGAHKATAAATATVEMRDGRRIQGAVTSYTHTGPEHPRELALAAPMRVQYPGQTVPVELPGDVLILQEQDILSINVTYVPVAPPATESDRRRARPVEPLRDARHRRARRRGQETQRVA
jgi:hypothetical protein